MSICLTFLGLLTQEPAVIEGSVLELFYISGSTISHSKIGVTRCQKAGTQNASQLVKWFTASDSMDRLPR